MHCVYPRFRQSTGLPRFLQDARLTGAKLCLVLACFALCACGAMGKSGETAADFTLLAYEDDAASLALAKKLNPAGQGLADWDALAPALAASLDYAQKQPQDAIAVAHGTTAITWADVSRTVAKLQSLLPRLKTEPQLLAEHFSWLRIRHGVDFSGYYEPLLKASRHKTPDFTHPLYRVPPDLHTLDLGQFKNSLIGQKIVYRPRGTQLEPYYDRAAIDSRGLLAGKGLELAWLNDPVDVFFLHVQGSGRLVFADGKEQPVLFAAHNGRPYVALGRRMRDLGLLEAGKVHLEGIREWLQAHPERLNEILHMNSSYVFFRFADKGPIGTMGKELSGGISLSVDKSLIPLGALLAFQVDTVQAGGVPTPVFGLGLAQDTLGAVKGRRIDIFWGRGEQAAFTAGHLNTRGEAWILLAK